MDWHKLWRAVNDEREKSITLRGWRALLRVASWGYGLGASIHQGSYDFALRAKIKVPTPVIGIGNITAGGTGKTPLTVRVVQTLLELGLKVAIISRGHGRQSKRPYTWVSRGEGPLLPAHLCGDEPYMLASKLPVPVLTGADRVLLAQKAIAELGRVIIVGDDLFQHRRLRRDLDIVALDASAPVGNGFMLPRGPLREPATGLRRAQAIVLTRAEDEQLVKQTKIWLRGFWGNGPVLSCRHRVNALHDMNGQAIAWQGRPKVLAFCGLARPDHFAASLKQMGLNVVELADFPDHHWFSARELQDLAARARGLGVQALVTTEKDQARLQAAWKGALPLWISRLELVFEDEFALTRLLVNALADWKLN